MQEYRHLQVGGQAQLLLQGLFLLRARRKITVEVQPAFAHRPDLWFGEQGAQALAVVTAPVLGVMGVHAGGAEQPLGALVEFPAQAQRMVTFAQAGAGQHQLADTCAEGTFEHCRVLVVEACVGQIDADVDELHGVTLENERAQHSRAFYHR